MPGRTPLPPPHPAIRISVVVPARNEKALIGSCLAALARQEGISAQEYEVLLVLDHCTDTTEARALEVAAEHPDLRLHLLEGPGRGAGHARRAGMEEAYDRLMSSGRPDGLIASTDADTVVAPDWLSAQLQASSSGARAIGGRIELRDDGDLPQGVVGWHAKQGRIRQRELLAGLGSADAPLGTEHWQFSGASLALTAAAYAEIGGLEPRAALEDEYLERALSRCGIPIERPRSVRVTTSARLVGRANRGLARDLALASWVHDNTYDARDFTPENLLEKKRASGISVSVVVPMRGKGRGTAAREGLPGRGSHARLRPGTRLRRRPVAGAFRGRGRRRALPRPERAGPGGAPDPGPPGSPPLAAGPELRQGLLGTDQRSRWVGTGGSLRVRGAAPDQPVPSRACRFRRAALVRVRLPSNATVVSAFPSGLRRSLEPPARRGKHRWRTSPRPDPPRPFSRSQRLAARPRRSRLRNPCGRRLPLPGRFELRRVAVEERPPLDSL